jgi:hypothetical protein
MRETIITHWQTTFDSLKQELAVSFIAHSVHSNYFQLTACQGADKFHSRCLV